MKKKFNQIEKNETSFFHNLIFWTLLILFTINQVHYFIDNVLGEIKNLLIEILSKFAN